MQQTTYSSDLNFARASLPLYAHRDALERGFESLVLTNAMRPMMKCADGLLRLREAHDDRLTIRVSIDHYKQILHEAECGERSWAPMIEGFRLRLPSHSRWPHALGRRRR